MSDSRRSARRRIVDDLRRYMVGPSRGEDEALYAGRQRTYADGTSKIFIDQFPADFYHTGMLWPPDTDIDDEEDEQDDQGEDAESGSGDSVMVLANVSQQAAIGLTVQLEQGDALLRVHATWGTYALEPDHERERRPPKENTAEQPARAASTVESQMNLCWRRTADSLSGEFTARRLPQNEPVCLASHDDVELSVRRRTVGDLHFLTFSLVSRRTRDQGGGVGQRDFRVYQPKIEVISTAGEPVFRPNINTARRRDRDFWQQELLYREVRQFAVGHGIAAAWDIEGGAGRSRIWTDWIPEFEVSKASALVKGLPEFGLDIFSDPARCAEALALMQQLADAYGGWLQAQRSDVDGIIEQCPPQNAELLRMAVEGNLKECVRQHQRIVAGIQFLKTESMAMQAFQLANRAMALSMRRARPDSAPTWFPFQLAFMLISLPSIADAQHPERSVFDLIWFPTGGGKTEAYLGLSAFVLFHRCLTAEGPAQADGTAIITRYTLRTLTVQQFERTAIAVMACESVRRQHPKLREMRPWSIGLLVGSGATPKWLRRQGAWDVTSAEALLANWNENSRGALLPLKKCPWCETALGQDSLRLEQQPDRLTTRCLNPQCEFASGIPIAIVDEHLVNVPPSFVVATIDKFAQLAWEPTLSRLLGVGCPARPPDLIIQDELHLITDSLGTVAGLYETAIDRLAEYRGASPKLIGATATIRRAAEQIHSLFLRETAQFPPSGLRHNDSFFYREETDPAVPGRLYVGVHAQGRSPKHTLPRIIGGISQSATAIADAAARDDYWTLVCYFNSLRELGGALVIAEDDVGAFQKVVATAEKSEVRMLSQMVEMTSQIPSYRIPEILEDLKVSLTSTAADKEPIDLLFATNMISVGVDIGRLGAMVIAGQPKTTAEYIQASSRVGRPRGAAGLVVIQYNWTRPRDRSHYERFQPYHAAFYRFVEAATVTPFAPRARDQALRGAVAALARSLSFDPAQNRIDNPGGVSAALSASMEPIIDTFAQRVSEVDRREAASTRTELTQLTQDLAAFLLRRPGSPVFWTSWRVPPAERKNARYVLTDGEEGHTGLWPAMMSMRTTDSPSLLVLEDGVVHG